MQITPKDIGVSARFVHSCGHLGTAMHYQAERFAQSDRAHQEGRPCSDCHSAIELHLIKEAQEAARRLEFNPHPLQPDPELSDPALPREGDFWINKDTMVRVQRQTDGSYWLRRVPCNNVVYQTWVRDQQALLEFFAERAFKLLRRDRAPEPVEA